MRGRWIIVAIAGYAVIQPMTALAWQAHDARDASAWTWTLQVVLPVVVAVPMLLRRMWARYVMVVVLSLASSRAVFDLFWEGGSWPHVILGSAVAALNLVAATILWASPAVEAFFRSRER